MGNGEQGAACAICGEDRPDRFRCYFDGYLKLYRCLECGFVAQYPGPGRATTVDDYGDFYNLSFAARGQEFMFPGIHGDLIDITNRMIRLGGAGRLLDVGCGDGHFVAVCAKRGFECTGVEPSKQLSAYASERMGTPVACAPYSEALFPPESFDVISFIQVLEHIATPLDALRAAHHHLRPGGLLVIEIPSVHAPHFLAYRLTRIKWFVKPPNGVIDCHCGYYSPKTLSRLAAKAGFESASLVTGRWRTKYSGLLKLAATITDPIMNLTRIGGILYIGRKAQQSS